MWGKYYAWSPYQYSLNNPVSFLDENGKDFGFVVKPTEGANFGHTYLYFQDKQGQWYRYDQGNYENRAPSGGRATVTGKDYDATVKIDPVDGVPDDAILFKTTENQDKAISESAFMSQYLHNNDYLPYNLYHNNCTDAAVDVILDAIYNGTSVNIFNPWDMPAPNTWFKYLKEEIKKGTQKTDFRDLDKTVDSLEEMEEQLPQQKSVAPQDNTAVKKQEIKQ